MTNNYAVWSLVPIAIRQEIEATNDLTAIQAAKEALPEYIDALVPNSSGNSTPVFSYLDDEPVMFIVDRADDTTACYLRDGETLYNGKGCDVCGSTKGKINNGQ
jgi:hypothetical protein